MINAAPKRKEKKIYLITKNWIEVYLEDSIRLEFSFILNINESHDFLGGRGSDLYI